MFKCMFLFHEYDYIFSYIHIYIFSKIYICICIFFPKYLHAYVYFSFPGSQRVVKRKREKESMLGTPKVNVSFFKLLLKF